MPARLRLSQEVRETFIALHFLSSNIYSPRTLPSEKVTTILTNVYDHLFDISLPSRVLFFLFPTNVSILVRVRRYFPRSHEIFGRRKWQRSCSSRTRFSRTIWTLRALDKRREDERLSVIPFFFFFFFFGGRELPRATKSGPTLSGRHAKIEGRGTKGDIEDAFIWYCEDVRAHKKTGARPSVASPLSLGHPRPWKRTRLGSKVAAAMPDADFSIRRTKPANRGFLFPRFSSPRQISSNRSWNDVSLRIF